MPRVSANSSYASAFSQNAELTSIVVVHFISGYPENIHYKINNNKSEKERSDTRFFGLHSILGGKLDICGRDGLFYSTLDFYPKNWTSADVMTFFCIFNPGFFFFRSTTLNLTRHLKWFAIPDL